MRLMKDFLFCISHSELLFGIAHYFEVRDGQVYLGISGGIDDQHIPQNPRMEVLAEECSFKGTFTPDIQNIIQMLDYSGLNPECLKAIKGFPLSIIEEIIEEKKKNEI